MASIISRRLVANQYFTRSRQLPVRQIVRFASQVRAVTEQDLASFHSFLESQPAALQLKEFKKSEEFSNVIKHFRHEGATQEDINIMLAPAEDDPMMNGGYVNPPAIKRSLRDPYEDWWDKQERRNFGEPLHEDNDILGVFSLEEYNHFTPAKAAKGWLFYIAAIMGVGGIVYMFYPDKPALPRHLTLDPNFDFDKYLEEYKATKTKRPA